MAVLSCLSPIIFAAKAYFNADNRVALLHLLFFAGFEKMVDRKNAFNEAILSALANLGLKLTLKSAIKKIFFIAPESQQATSH